MTKIIETQEHLMTYATERTSQEQADRDEDMPPPGESRDTLVREWLERHPEIAVGAPEV